MERFEIEFHYALAAQRQVYLGDLLRALRPATREKPFSCVDWVRICDYRYSHQPLNAFGSTVGAGGRFNYGDALDNIKECAFPALYIASNERVAHREFFCASANDEVGLSSEDFALMRARDYALYHVNGTIHELLDLTRPTMLRKFAKVLSRFTVSKEVLALATVAGIEPRPLVMDVNSLLKALYEPNWRGWARQHGLPASCQIFGELAYSAGFEGILYRSTKRGGECLAVFPENFERSDSCIQLRQEGPPNAITKLDSSNWVLATRS